MSLPLSLDGEKYLASNCQAQYGIHLLFLTPNSDITASVKPPDGYLQPDFRRNFPGSSCLPFYILTGRLPPSIRLSAAIGEVRDTQEL